MEKNSQSSREPDDAKQPPSPTLSYLMDKVYPIPPRKVSDQTINLRQNFCLNFTNNRYTVLRVYIASAASLTTRLYYTKFTPIVKQGQICLIHGYGQCTDDYLKIAEFFATHGYVVHMIDLRGHGYSGGDRVNQHTKCVLVDISTLLTNCCERDLSTFILSHGLGSIYVNALLQQNRMLPIAGVINISPLIKFMSFSTIGTHLRDFLLTINPFLFGNLLVHNRINPSSLVKNPMAIKAKIQNVFFQSFITLKMASQYDWIGDKVASQSYKFSYPILICYGSKDSIQPYEQIKRYFDKITSEDKQLKLYPEGYHEMHKDYESQQIMEKILSWMKTRTGKVKWKRPKSFEIKSICRKSNFWKYFFMVITLLASIILMIKKFKKFVKFLKVK